MSGGLHSMVSQELGMTEHVCVHTHTHIHTHILMRNPGFSLINHSWPKVFSQLAANIYSAVPM